MVRQAVGIVLICGLVTGCARVSESRLNPLNWFGRSTPAPTVSLPGTGAIIDDRPLIETITALEIERTPGGAIIRAAGVAPVQGWYGAELTPENRDAEPVDGVVTFFFRALPPLDPTRVSTPASRELVVATYLTDAALEGVREIRVVAQTNARVARR